MINTLKPYLQPLQSWLDSLEKRERLIVIYGGIALFFILLYLIIWDPIMTGYEEQQLKNQSQRQLYSMVQNAATEIQSITAAGGSSASRFRNQSISSLADRSATVTGVKGFISKIDQSKNGVKVNLKSADFDRIIAWLADMENKYAITATRVKIDRTKVAGAVDADITLERS